MTMAIAGTETTIADLEDATMMTMTIAGIEAAIAMTMMTMMTMMTIMMTKTVVLSLS